MREIRRIVLHHSASALSTTFADIEQWHTGPKQLSGGGFKYKGRVYTSEAPPLEARHVRGRGWSTIGYHGVIEASGRFVPGRGLDRPGAHARGANEDSIGICLVGDNTDSDRGWMCNQKMTARVILEGLFAFFPKALLYGHRDIGLTATLCPGLEVRDLFPHFPHGPTRG